MEQPSKDELRRWDQELYWHAFTQMAEYVPLIIERAEGCTLYDVDGNAYLDGVSSMWCSVHGHGHPKLNAALREQIDRVAHVTSLGMSNPTTIRLAKRLVALAPKGLNHVFFSDDGATAVEVAIKMALQYWQQCPNPQPEKSIYVALGEAYHGDTLGSVSVGGVARFHAAFKPLLFDTLRLPTPDTYRLPSGVSADGAREYYLAQLNSLLAEHHRRIAAMVIEPLVQGAAGMVMHPPGYLKGVRELTKKYGVLLIADEVAVGFGRTGRMFACEHEGVTPDLLCLAKGISAGYLPFAATLTTSEIWRTFLGRYDEAKTFCHGHTYGGNPLGAAVALASLDVFETEQTLSRLAPKISRLSEHLQRIADLPHVGDARQRGLIGAVELAQDRTTKTAFPWQERRGFHVCELALKKGVWLRPLVNVIAIVPPLSVTIAELDRICAAVEFGIRECFASPQTQIPSH
jgi:adenosylmethionine-8-amino-7-oxononanoate aminotransferase